MNEDRIRQMVDARLTAEWLATTDDDGDPGEWFPCRVLPIGEVNEVELEVVPVWRTNLDGQCKAWSNRVPGPGRPSVEAWMWIDEAERDFAFFCVDGSHAERPPVPDDLIAYLADPDGWMEREGMA